MTRSKDYVSSRLSSIGAAVCSICGIRKADCVRVKKNWFSSIEICDSCGRELFLSFDKKRRGAAK